jgi:hypothetical protein
MGKFYMKTGRRWQRFIPEPAVLLENISNYFLLRYLIADAEGVMLC